MKVVCIEIRLEDTESMPNVVVSTIPFTKNVTRPAENNVPPAVLNPDMPEHPVRSKYRPFAQHLLDNGFPRVTIAAALVRFAASKQFGKASESELKSFAEKHKDDLIAVLKLAIEAQKRYNTIPSVPACVLWDVLIQHGKRNLGLFFSSLMTGKQKEITQMIRQASDQSERTRKQVHLEALRKFVKEWEQSLEHNNDIAAF